MQGNLDPLALLAGGEALDARGRRASLTPSRDRPHIFNLGHGILPGHADRACRAAARAGAGTRDERHRLAARRRPISWVKAAHIIFVIFWMAGLFMLPRFYVYHQEAAPGSAEDSAWIERESKLAHDHPHARR